MELLYLEKREKKKKRKEKEAASQLKTKEADT